jgi:hypothetical protein
MTTFPRSPRLLKGGLVLIDPDTAAIVRVIALQYYPDTLSRTLQAQAGGAEGGDRSEPLRLKGPAVETIKIEAEIDALDPLDVGVESTGATGIHPQLAALELLVYPTSDQLQASGRLARNGTLEIAPVEAPLTLFVWSKHRILPVRLTEFSITEEAFDAGLNPIRAKVSLGMRVLSVSDLGFDHKGGGLFMGYLQQKEALAAGGRGLGALGIGAIP